VLLYI